MSKQFKYKLKKTMKQAEFVHADLEYHEELGEEARVLFQQEVSKYFSELPDSVRKELENWRLLKASMPKAGSQDPYLDEESSDCTDLVKLDSKESPKDLKQNNSNIKKSEIKKLFRKIAEKTHPDKLIGAGYSAVEVERSEKIFKRAKSALDNDNWFVLYGIALDLEIEVEKESELHLEWIEVDIANTLRKIKDLTNLTAWHWYIGDEPSKNDAIKYYFSKIFNFEHPGL